MDIFLKSKRCRRSSEERTRIRQILANVDCVPNEISDSSFDLLCNEIDLLVLDKSTLYLQNTVSDSIFIVLDGSISFYFEPDPQIQMFMQQQGTQTLIIDHSYADNFDSNILGSFVGQYKVGQCFGEFDVSQPGSTLPKKKLFQSAESSGQRARKKTNVPAEPLVVTRSCSAVVSTDGTKLLVIYADTCKRILKAQKSIQRDLLSKAATLRQLTPYVHASYSTLAQVAHNTARQEYTHTTRLAAYGVPIDKIYIIVGGKIKVSSGLSASPKKASGESESVPGCDLKHSTLVQSHLQQPAPTIAVLGPGQVVGELEVTKGLQHYKFHYDVQSLHLQVLELPYDVYLSAVKYRVYDDPKWANSLLLSPSERTRMQEYRAFRRKCLVKPVTSVQACPVDESVASCSEDDGAAAQLQETPPLEAEDRKIFSSIMDTPMILHVASLHCGNCPFHSRDPSSIDESQPQDLQELRRESTGVVTVPQQLPSQPTVGAAVPSSPAQHKKMKSFPQLSPRARAHLPTSAAASDSPRGKPTHSPSPHPGIAQSNHSKLDMASGGCGGVSANVSPSPLGAPSCSPPFGSPRFRPRVISPRCSPRGNKQAACDALIYSNRNSEGLDGFPSPAEDVALESAAFESRLQILHSSLQNMSASVAAGAGAGAGAEDSAGAGGEDSADVSVYGSSVCEVSTVGIINPGSLLGGASSLIHGGPSTCLEYAASVREAEENVVQEMQRIRSRVQGKQHRKYRQFGHRQQHQHQQHDGKGLFSPEDSSCLLDGSYVDMSSDCSLATASFFPLEGSTDTL